MNIKEAKEEIKNSVQAYLEKDDFGDYKIPSIRQRPLLLIGPPGIGKTQIMEQIARECEIGLVAYTITHHTRQSAVGLPFIKEMEYDGVEYSITEYTMSEIIASVYEKMRKTGLKEGILFIDEINCVSETLAPTMLQFLQCKTFGNQKVPEGWIIVAAGNPPEYNKSVRDFDMVTLDRVRYLNVEANYEVWKQYAYEHQINDAILSYLELKPNKFYHVESDIDGMKFVTARGWEDLSNLMDTYEQLHIPLSEEIIKEFIHHEDIAEDVYSYFLLYKKYQDDYGIQDIMHGKVSTSVYARIMEASFDERISVVNLLLNSILNKFNVYKNQKQLTDTYFKVLKQYRTLLNTTDTPKTSFDTLINEFKEEIKNKEKEEILTKEDIHLYNKLFDLLNASSMKINDSINNKECFFIVKDTFDDSVDTLASTAEDINQCLDHIFTFMEDAFTSGQEMLVFVSGLSLHSTAALYLSEYKNDKYEIYKQTLLIGNRKTSILDELERN